MLQADTPRIIGETTEGIVAVHKPAGMKVHPANDDGSPDLTTWLVTARGIPGGLVPAQRIDGAASGIVLCAAAPAMRGKISGWLAEGLIEKTYLVVVHGRTRKKGVIRRPLQDARRGRALAALTRYTWLEWIGGYTLLAVQIATGRKHQIRRHLHGLGHPVVGDKRYRTRRTPRVPGWPDRLWLHARVTILPDGTVFEDPLPLELLDNLEAIRSGAASPQDGGEE